MKKITLLLLGLCVGSSISAQILTVKTNASISIAPGSSVSVGGLELSPDETYVISGYNSISRSSSPIAVGNNTSIGRVFSSAELFNNYSGTLTFSYLEGDLNGIDEEDLVLELQNEDDSWTAYESTIDTDNNTISYVFSEVAFKAVTASPGDATLTVDDPKSWASILVYPNPTSDRLFINAENIAKITLYDIQGRKVRTSTQNQINMSRLENGVYILKVATDQNTSSSFKIIKQ
jgi:hypothetical protein